MYAANGFMYGKNYRSVWGMYEEIKKVYGYCMEKYFFKYGECMHSV